MPKQTYQPNWQKAQGMDSLPDFILLYWRYVEPKGSAVP